MDNISSLSTRDTITNPYFSRVSSLASLGPDPIIDNNKILLPIMGLEKTSKPGDS